MNSAEDLLIDCALLISRFINNRNRGLKLQAPITKFVKDLYRKFGIRREEIESRLWFKFRTRQRHLKYDPSRSPIETYVAYFTYYELLTMVCECQRYRAQQSEIPLSQLACGETVSTIGRSTEPYEKEGIEGLTDPCTPEDHIIGNELMDLAGRYFGQTDLEVLLGITDRKAAAEKLGMNYYSYCKHLNRKVERFRHIINKHGYGLL